MLSEEERKRMIKELREFKLPYDKKAVKEVEGEKIVDWKRITEMLCTAREGTPSATMLYGTLDHLIDLKVLSLEPEGNYQVTTSGILLNPRSHGFLETYFVRKKDAEAYKEAKFSKALYPIDIFKLSKS